MQEDKVVMQKLDHIILAEMTKLGLVGGLAGRAPANKGL